MSRPPARHCKPPRPTSRPDRDRSARHRKPSPISSALQDKPAQVAAVAAGAILAASAGSAAVLWSPGSHHLPTSSQAYAFDSMAANASVRARSVGIVPASHRTAALPQLAPTGKHALGTPSAKPASGRPGRHRRRRHTHPQPQATTQAVYRNPLRDVSGLIPERIDMGVDFGGSGPVYALGDGVVTNASADNAGWPGGGWITYKLTDGPDAGLVVYLAEDVTPTVQVGQQVTSSTVIANMYNGSDGIETGWAMADSSSAESQLPEAGGISGGGPFPTMVGLNFEEMLQALGVPAANNWGATGYGTLPSQYPPWQAPSSSAG